MLNLLVSQKISLICSFEPVLGFIQRSSGYTNKSFIVFESTSACSFSNIGANAIGRSDKLAPDSTLWKIMPLNYNFPDLIGKFFRELINFKCFKITFCHVDHKI